MAGVVEGGEVRARPLLVLRGEPVGSAAERHRLEGEPDREQLAQLLDVEPHDLRPVVGHVLGQAERLELPDRLADRGDAHPERAGEILEPERRARRQLAEDDRLAQTLEGGLGHGAVPDGTAAGDGALHGGGA